MFEAPAAMPTRERFFFLMESVCAVADVKVSAASNMAKRVFMLIEFVKKVQLSYLLVNLFLNIVGEAFALALALALALAFALA